MCKINNKKDRKLKMNNQHVNYNNLGQPVGINTTGTYVSGQPMTVPLQTGTTGVIPGSLHTGTNYGNTGYGVTTNTTGYVNPVTTTGYTHPNTHPGTCFHNLSHRRHKHH